jgi:epoxyqueuosine reductase
MTDAGSDCVSLGCRARQHCPVGLNYIYSPPQAGFHMRAFLKAQS